MEKPQAAEAKLLALVERIRGAATGRRRRWLDLMFRVKSAEQSTHRGGGWFLKLARLGPGGKQGLIRVEVSFEGLKISG